MEESAKTALLDELRAKYGVVFSIEDEDLGLVVFRKATKLEARAFKADRDDDMKKVVADEVFIKKVIVHPDAVTLEKLFDDFPFAIQGLTNSVFKASGGKPYDAKKV